MNITASRALLVLIVFALVPCAALAAEDAPPAPADPFTSLIRLVGSMVLVIGLILAAAFVTKKVFAKARFRGGQNKLLRVQQTESLGGRRQILVLDVGESMLVVGAAGDNMCLLAKLPKSACETPDAPGDEASFEEMLSAGAADRPADGEGS